VSSQPDCTGIQAWWDITAGYPCEAEDQAIETACAGV
jgi:hypothetical protein